MTIKIKINFDSFNDNDLLTMLCRDMLFMNQEDWICTIQELTTSGNKIVWKGKMIIRIDYTIEDESDKYLFS